MTTKKWITGISISMTLMAISISALFTVFKTFWKEFAVGEKQRQYENSEKDGR
jgi:hypothetical protein